MVLRHVSYYAYVGIAIPRGSSPIDRRFSAWFVCQEVDDEMTKLMENLNRMTLDIPNILADDLPRRYQ